MTTPQVNANFHTLTARPPGDHNEAYRRYREMWAANPRHGIVGEFPLFVDIEVTSVCNLRCPFCATTYRQAAIPQGFIEFPLVRKIIDEGSAHGLYGCKFNYRGEPLLHPEIDRMVAYAKERGLLDVYFNTNGVRLDEAMSRKLIDAGLDRISVSFEGTTPEVYERNRAGARYDVVLRHVELLQNLKARLGVTHPRLRVQTVRLPEIDLAEYQRFWAGRADEVACLDYKEMKERRCGVVADWACPQLWQRLVVWWDGTIMPCNHDDEAKLALGNAHADALRECWRSAALDRVRAAHRCGRSHEISGCDGCYLRDSEIRKPGE